NVVETAQARITEIEEEESSEEGLFADLEKVNATETGKLLKHLKPTNKLKPAAADEYGMVAEPRVADQTHSNQDVLEEYLDLDISIKKANAEIKKLNAELQAKVLSKYPTLTEADVKQLVIHRKWQGALAQALTQEQEKISQNLTGRIKALAERYAVT